MGACDRREVRGGMGMSECVSLEALSRVLVDLASREREQRGRGEEGMRDWVRARVLLEDACQVYGLLGIGGDAGQVLADVRAAGSGDEAVRRLRDVWVERGCV